MTVRNAVDQRRLREENRTLRRAAESRHEIVGDSPALERVRDAIGKAAPTNATVLILGESGVGKELVARAIHRNSLRAARALRAGELRGDPRGADRVGAVRPREGLVHRRHREADRQVRAGRSRHDLPRRSRRHERRRRRPRCCACCRSGEVERLGSARTIKVDVRVIAATNKNLEEEIDARRVPRGSLLPPERDPDPRAAAARAPRGHPAARAALRRAVRRARTTSSRGASRPQRDGGAAAAPLARQHPRAAQHRRAAADHDARRRRRCADIRTILRVGDRAPAASAGAAPACR